MLKKIALCLIAALVIMTFFTLPTGAFDSNDYDGGDWGGGYDNDWGGSSWDSDWGDGSGGGLGLSGFSLIFIGIVIYIVIKASSTKKHQVNQTGGVRPSSREGLHIQLPDRTAQIEGVIKGHDPDFSANDFLSFAKRVYIDIQMAWCKRDMPSVRAFLHDNLYDATVRQVQAKIHQGVVYHYESMVVNTAYLTSYAKDGQFEYLTVYLNARMIDWQEDEKTGAILRGDKTTRWDLRYKMRFMRTAGIRSRKETAGTTKHSCPNCGAPLEMTSSAQCPYCHSVVTTGQYSWVLSDFGTIRNDTIDEGIRMN